ncbi:MAG: 1-acyl-sn-glycerol-3-phosphate acyltransferase [Deltaproteobacteria bacterium]|nr:1-acyl-sn-glycerol-3-phosphate acyltransferase [Deltaproteobacteria bacterium]
MGEFIKEIKDTAVSIKSWVIIIFATIFFAIAAIIISLFGNAEKAQKVARLWGKTIIRLLGINVIASGAENISPENSYIITSNHQSYFDIFVLLVCLNLNFKFIAKASLFKIPFLGWSMKRLGYIPIDRENLRSALKSVKKSTELLKNKTSILIFPEGTRSLDGELLSFKKGGLNMFLKQGNLTVLPVAIKGTVNILRKNSLTIHPGKTVELHILQPIEVSEKNKVLASGREDGIIKTIEEEIRAALEFK